MKFAIVIILTFFSALLAESGSIVFSEYFLSPEMFGCISNQREYAERNSTCLQNMIDKANAEKKTIISSAGKKYYIKKGLVISGYVNIDFGGASIVALDSNEMITLEMDNVRWKGVIRNLKLDLNSVAKVGYWGKFPEKIRITDGEINGIGENAVGMSFDKGFEVFVDNIHFRGVSPRATGIRLKTSDCHFSNIVMIDCQKGFELYGSNFFSQIHAWIQDPKLLKGSQLFDIKRGADNFMSQIFSDTYEVAYLIETEARLHITELKIYHNEHKWDDLDSSIVKSYLFFFSDSLYAKNSSIIIQNSHIGYLLKEGENRMLCSNINQFDCKWGTVLWEKGVSSVRKNAE